MRFILVLAFALAACERPAPSYPPDYEVGFMAACQGGGSSPQRCSCIWDQIEAQIEPQDFAALERLPRAEREAHPMMQRIQGFAQQCPNAPVTPQEGELPPAP